MTSLAKASIACRFATMPNWSSSDEPVEWVWPSSDISNALLIARLLFTAKEMSGEGERERGREEDRDRMIER